MANQNLTAAKSAKNDEFYTQFADIQKEVNAYLEYDPDVFRGKTVLLPCDDPEWSNFTKFFAQNFERFGLKKLISTSYAVESKNAAAGGHAGRVTLPAGDVAGTAGGHAGRVTMPVADTRDAWPPRPQRHERNDPMTATLKIDLTAQLWSLPIFHPAKRISPW